MQHPKSNLIYEENYLFFPLHLYLFFANKSSSEISLICNDCSHPKMGDRVKNKSIFTLSNETNFNPIKAHENVFRFKLFPFYINRRFIEFFLE